MPENYRLGAIIGSALFVFPVLAFGIWAFMHWRKNCESLRVLLIVLIPVLMPSLLFGYVNLHNANFAASKGTRQVTALYVNVEPTVQSDDYASVRDFTDGNVMLVTIQSKRFPFGQMELQCSLDDFYNWQIFPGETYRFTYSPAAKIMIEAVRQK